MQAFLEANLQDGLDHSQEVINALKVKWRKLYLSEYNKKYKEDHIQITYRLNRKQYRKLITKAKQEDQKPTVYCRRLVIDCIEGNTAIDHPSLRIMIMNVVDIIEHAQYEGEDIPGEKVLKILSKMLDELK